MKELILLAISLSCTILSYREIQPPISDETQQTQQETLYLPNGQALQFMSFGYQNTLAHFLWFKTINYFGKHYQSDRNYRWLEHMCDLVSSLNSAMTHTSQFCATMLAWEANDVEASNRILTRAIENHPQDWFFLYLRGFNYAFFLKDEARAKDDFVAASHLPNAHPVVIRIAGKKLFNLSSPHEAIRFLKNMVAITKDEKARAALMSRLNEATYENDFRLLEKAASEYLSRYGNQATDIHQLAQAGLLTNDLIARNFRDPYGGFYSLDMMSGKVRSSSGKERPKLYRKK